MSLEMLPDVSRVPLEREFSTRAWKMISPSLQNSMKKPFERVIDFGCGTGETTYVLAEWIRELNHKCGLERPKLSITGFDISPVKTLFCQNLYCSSTKDSEVEFEFKTLDIGDRSTLDPKWESASDLVTSFLAVHWVEDQNTVLRNIHYCLKPGGYFGIYCQTGFAGVPGNANNELKEKSYLENGIKHYAMTLVSIGIVSKWSSYLPPGGMSQDLFKGQAAYHPWGLPDPAKGFAELAVNAGFRVLDARNDVFVRVYENEAEMARTVKLLASSLKKKIPDEKLDEFASDFVNEFKRLDLCEEIEGEKKLKVDMGVIVIVGQKV